MKNLTLTSPLGRILTLGLTSLFLTPVCSADSPQHWSSLEKTEKPSHEGINAKLKNGYVFLSFAGRSTCIPKTCVLNLPEELATRVSSQPQFKVVDWNEFLNTNFSWISSYPVTWEQVTGREALTDAALKNLSEAPSLMIATYRKNPISVLPPKELEKVATAN